MLFCCQVLWNIDCVCLGEESCKSKVEIPITVLFLCGCKIWHEYTHLNREGKTRNVKLQ